MLTMMQLFLYIHSSVIQNEQSNDIFKYLNSKLASGEPISKFFDMTDPENRRNHTFLTNCILVMDLMLIVNFWFMNYHALLWNKTNPYTVKLNLNLKIE